MSSRFVWLALFSVCEQEGPYERSGGKGKGTLCVLNLACLAWASLEHGKERSVERAQVALAVLECPFLWTGCIVYHDVFLSLLSCF